MERNGEWLTIGAAAQLKRAKPGPLPTIGNRHSAVGNSATACPVCRKPFQDDEEVGPVPTCECGTRGKADQEPGQDAADETEDEFRLPDSSCPFALPVRVEPGDGHR